MLSFLFTTSLRYEIIIHFTDFIFLFGRLLQVTHEIVCKPGFSTDEANEGWKFHILLDHLEVFRADGTQPEAITYDDKHVVAPLLIATHVHALPIAVSWLVVPVLSRNVEIEADITLIQLGCSESTIRKFSCTWPHYGSIRAASLLLDPR